jgi:hypothetical protein
MLGKHLLMASITIVSSAFFLGLAVLGWGGFGAFLAHPPFIALLIRWRSRPFSATSHTPWRRSGNGRAACLYR